LKRVKLELLKLKRTLDSLSAKRLQDEARDAVSSYDKDKSAERAAQVAKVYQDGLKDEPGNKFIQELAESVKPSPVPGDKTSEVKTKGVGFVLAPEEITELSDNTEIDRLCPVLISSTTGQTKQRVAVKTCAELEEVIVKKLLVEEESIWNVNSAMESTLKEIVLEHSTITTAFDTSAANETQDLVRTQSNTLLQIARAQPLLRMQSLGTGKKKQEIKHAWNFAKMAKALLDKATAQLAQKRSEAHKKEKDATSKATDFETKLEQVLSVLSNKNMSRANATEDSRSERGKEQVVRIEAVGATILWVNCTIGRLDQLLRNLERECVEGNGLSWLGSRYGVVTVLDVCVAKPTPEQFTDNTEPSCASWFYPTDRLPIEEIYTNIKSGCDLTGEFMWGLACAGVIAAVGLFTNSSVMLVASMLISPMMGPILAITFAMAIKTKASQTVRRTELRAVKDMGDLTNLSETYRQPLKVGDVVQLPETICFDKGKNNGEMKRRLGKLVSLKDTPENNQDGGHITTWLVKPMVAENEWHAEWDDEMEAPDELSFPVSESELSKPEAVLLRPLTPGTMVPYLGHCATVRRVVKRPPGEEPTGAVAKSRAEAETLYEVDWDPAETLDVKKYEASLAQKPVGGDKPRELEIVPSTTSKGTKTVHVRLVSAISMTYKVCVNHDLRLW
jgi:hypothetical protein